MSAGQRLYVATTLEIRARNKQREWAADNVVCSKVSAHVWVNGFVKGKPRAAQIIVRHRLVLFHAENSAPILEVFERWLRREIVAEPSALRGPHVARAACGCPHVWVVVWWYGVRRAIACAHIESPNGPQSAQEGRHGKLVPVSDRGGGEGGIKRSWG